MKMTLTFFYDPGHAWLGVRRAMLKKLGIAEKISPASHQDRKDNDTVYLEEDCDASLFLSVARKRGWNIELKEYYCGNYAFVRDLEPYVYD